jgi:hypothetical protein
MGGLRKLNEIKDEIIASLPSREEVSAANAKAWAFQAEFKPLQDQVAELDKRLLAFIASTERRLPALDLLRQQNASAERTCLDAESRMEDRQQALEQALRADREIFSELIARVEVTLVELQEKLDKLGLLRKDQR